MSQPNNPSRDLFEEHVADLLGRAARVARPNPALGDLVRQRLTSAETPHIRQRLRAGLWAYVAQYGSIAAAALVVGAVVLALLNHGGGSTRHPLTATTPVASATTASATPAPSCSDPSAYNTVPTSAPTPDNSVAIGQSATSNGITITIDRAYADATQTVLVLHVGVSGSPTQYTLVQSVITDGSGGSYAMIEGGGTYNNGTPRQQLAIFSPVAPNELGVAQRFTLSSARVDDINGNSKSVTSDWRIPFTLTPVEGTTLAVSLPAQTHDGVTISVKSVTIAPAGGGLDGQNGGVVIRMRISGLPAQMPLLGVAEYSNFFQSGPGGGAGGGSPGRLPGDMGCPRLDLRYFNSLPLLPGFLLVNQKPPAELGNDANRDPKTWPTVGPSGSAELDALFFGPFTDGKMVLTMDGIRIGTPASGLVNGQAADLRVAHGPWVFSIPLQQP